MPFISDEEYAQLTGGGASMRPPGNARLGWRNMQAIQRTQQLAGNRLQFDPRTNTFAPTNPADAGAVNAYAASWQAAAGTPGGAAAPVMTAPTAPWGADVAPDRRAYLDRMSQELGTGWEMIKTGGAGGGYFRPRTGPGDMGEMRAAHDRTDNALGYGGGRFVTPAPPPLVTPNPNPAAAQAQGMSAQQDLAPPGPGAVNQNQNLELARQSMLTARMTTPGAVPNAQAAVSAQETQQRAFAAPVQHGATGAPTLRAVGEPQDLAQKRLAAAAPVQAPPAPAAPAYTPPAYAGAPSAPVAQAAPAYSTGAVNPNTGGTPVLLPVAGGATPYTSGNINPNTGGSVLLPTAGGTVNVAPPPTQVQAPSYEDPTGFYGGGSRWGAYW